MRRRVVVFCTALVLLLTSLALLRDGLADQATYGAHAPYIAKLKEEIATLSETKGPAHDAIGALWYLLAVNYHHARAYDEAEAAYLEALPRLEAMLGPDHLALADALEMQTALYLVTAQPHKGLETAVRMTNIRRAQLGNMHEDTATGLHMLGRLYAIRGDYKTSRQYFEAAVHIRERLLGTRDPKLIMSLAPLGTATWPHGAFELASPHHQWARQVAAEDGTIKFGARVWILSEYLGFLAVTESESARASVEAELIEITEGGPYLGVAADHVEGRAIWFEQRGFQEETQALLDQVAQIRCSPRQ